MVTIQVDEETAAELRKQAASAGLELVDYLRKIAAHGTINPIAVWSDLEHDLDRLSSSGPQPTGTFSRAEIYADHD